MERRTMANDMMVALGTACVHGRTLFGLNHHTLPGTASQLWRFEGSMHALDETIALSHLRLPQTRQTYAVLGQQPEGQWGLTHGINEHQLAIGVTGWYSRLPRAQEGLTGADLARLALERSHSCLQAVDVLTSLIGRYGQCSETAEGPADHVFLLADPNEAYILEAAGRYWALMECRQTRVATGVALTRQDWSRLAPGLADFAVAQGWWQDDGSKLDFTGCLDSRHAGHTAARRRWGRASVALAQQAGAIDGHLFRHLLDEQGEKSRALLPVGVEQREGSFLAELVPGQAAPLAWCAFGPPAYALYFPLCPLGALPVAFGLPAHPESPSIAQCIRQLPELVRSGRVELGSMAEMLERLQTLFDQDAEQFLQKARTAGPGGSGSLATTLMQRHAEMFEEAWRQLCGSTEAAEVADWVDEEGVPAPF
jgi:hypothetical protein